MIHGGRDTPPSDKDAIVSAPRDIGKTVLATVNQYLSVHKRGCHGALVEETSAFRSDIEQFSDLHVLLWDADLRQVLDVREDAVESSVIYDSSRVPELHIENRFRFVSGYEATLSQDPLVAVDHPALCLRNHVDFEHAEAWATAAGLLPERVDGNGDVRWNSNLQWAQATFVLLVESHVREIPYGMAPDG